MRNITGEKGDKMALTMKLLVGVVIVLLLFIAYFFVVNPQINKFVYKKQIEAANSVLGDMISQIQAQGYYAIPVGNETLVLVPYVPPQQGVVPGAQ